MNNFNSKHYVKYEKYKGKKIEIELFTNLQLLNTHYDTFNYRYNNPITITNFFFYHLLKLCIISRIRIPFKRALPS